jgi:uncharacterized protein YqhQ
MLNRNHFHIPEKNYDNYNSDYYKEYYKLKKLENNFDIAFRGLLIYLFCIFLYIILFNLLNHQELENKDNKKNKND